jgi:pSer/pThr/pTyr-binding forkhead associated (FHA) protein
VASLVVRTGPELGKEYALPESGEFKIGRLPAIGITLVDAKVSREHCKISRQSTGWIVEDLGSRNGTYVNVQRVKKRLLQPWDRLRVGQTEFEFAVAGAAAAPAPAAAPIPAPVRAPKPGAGR